MICSVLRIFTPCVSLDKVTVSTRFESSPVFRWSQRKWLTAGVESDDHRVHVRLWNS